ncbi:MAG: hypothetical protein WCP62_11565, partial [Planctomycetota bacterium]
MTVTPGVLTQPENCTRLGDRRSLLWLGVGLFVWLFSVEYGIAQTPYPSTTPGTVPPTPSYPSSPA